MRSGIVARHSTADEAPPRPAQARRHALLFLVLLVAASGLTSAALPPAGADTCPMTGWFQIEVTGVGSDLVKASGQGAIMRQPPVPGPNGTMIISTGLTSLDLAGTSPLLGSVRITLKPGVFDQGSIRTRAAGRDTPFDSYLGPTFHVDVSALGGGLDASGPFFLHATATSIPLRETHSPEPQTQVVGLVDPVSGLPRGSLSHAALDFNPDVFILRTQGSMTWIFQGPPEQVGLSGTSVVVSSAAVDPGDGRPEFNTDLLSVSLAGTGAHGLLQLVGQDGQVCSGRTKALNPGSAFPADSFFDISYRIDSNPFPAFSASPVHQDTTAAGWPPIGIAPYSSAAPVSLVNAAGGVVGQLGAVSWSWLGLAGQCVDADGDGVFAPPCGDDCDDSDPLNFPGNLEDCGDGRDNDCDGLSDCADQSCRGRACDDHDLCTSGDVCTAGGVCAGSPLNCTDGNPCTLDACDGQTGLCGHTPEPDGTACDDGTACTLNDACVQGACRGTAVSCSDGDLCTTDACDVKTGQCVFTPVTCDDANLCTVDSCNPATGLCAHSPVVCNDSNACTTAICDVKTGGCVSVPKDCEDGDPCTADACDPATGQCLHTPVVCDDANPCTQDVCDPRSGGCVHVVEPDGTPCDDGDRCTTGDICQGGQCATTRVDCTDGDACTTDVCDPATGQCGHVPVSCDDGNGCTTDRCGPTCVVPDAGGTATLPPQGCDYTSPVALTGPGLQVQLTARLRDVSCPATTPAVCTFTPPIPGVDCAQAGGTLGGEQECADAVVMLTFTVQGQTRSVDVPVSLETQAAPRTPGDPLQSFAIDLFRLSGEATGTPDFALLRMQAGSDFGMPSPGHTTLSRSGSDWAVESTIDVSYRLDYTGMPFGILQGQSGTLTGTVRLSTGAPGCVHEPVNLNCDDGDACTVDACDPATGQCSHQPVSCDDFNACTVDSCDPQTGCRHVAVPDGEACDDGDACTLNDACVQGSCRGTAVSCSDGDLCTTDACDVKTGQCVFTPVTCDDANPCTADSCDPATGACRHDPLPVDTPCDDGSVCTSGDHCVAGQCVGTSEVVCDDGNPCTLDTCDPQQKGTCLHVPVPDGTACTDGDLCTTGDACRSGSCVPTARVDCTDGDACTTDVCDPLTGQCGHAPVSCDDGNGCTTDRCGPTCVVPDAGGTATLPPGGCAYTGSFLIGPQLLGITAVLRDTVCPATTPEGCSFTPPVPGADCEQPGGLLGGEESCADATLDLTFDAGPGVNRTVHVPVSLEIHTGPRTVGDPAQIFPIDVYRLSGEITGDAWFEQLQIRAGTAFGMPSPGRTVLARAGSDWVVQGYFDLSSRIDYVGTFGGPLLGRSGTLQGTGRMSTGQPTCVHDPVTPGCDDGDACTVDACDPATGQCSHQPVSCDDFNACTVDSCDPQTGCRHVAVPDGEACDDGDACTLNDACVQGSCRGTAVSCSDGDLCTTDACDVKTGQCVFTPVTCDDANPCTADSCDPATGACRHDPLPVDTPCDDGSVCTSGDHCVAGQCVGTSEVVCDDGNPCTLDTCDPQQKGTCLHVPVPDGTACTDGDLCTTGDACRSGSCVPTARVDCTDGDACTTDVCDPLTGQCGHAPVSCDDGNGCTTDRCGPTCVVPDAGGTATLPPQGCDYTSPVALTGPGLQVQLTARLRDVSCPATTPAVCTFTPPIPGVDCAQAGGTLGGEQECADAVVMLTFTVQGQTRSVDVPVSLETQAAPRTPGDPLQSFAIDLFRLSGEATGTPDFALLRMQAGSDFGMPSPGHTTLSRSGSDWAVESTIDVSYRLDYTGMPFGILQGQSGTLTGTVRLSTGAPGCVHEPVNLNCDDGDACTVDACDPATGQCAHIPATCDDGDACTIDRCDPVAGCVHAPAALAEVDTIDFLDDAQFQWPPTADALQYNAYRGTIPSRFLGSRPAATLYDHVCRESADEFSDGATLSTDSSAPPLGTAYYYLITGEGTCGESVPGRASSGTPIPNASPCPTPP